MITIVGLFESRAQARRAKGELIRAHIASPNVFLYDRSTADASRGSEHNLWQSLKDTSGFAEDRSFYEEGMRRGGTVVTVRVNDAQLNQAAEILSRHGAVEPALPVAEEEQGGKRDIEGGKVRVYKRAA